jgi:hypothetical protein
MMLPCFHLFCLYLLTHHFFIYSTCNIYHTLFYRIICLVFASHHEPTLDILFHRESLVKRLIDEYQDTKRITGNRIQNRVIGLD